MLNEKLSPKFFSQVSGLWAGTLHKIFVDIFHLPEAGDRDITAQTKTRRYKLNEEKLAFTSKVSSRTYRGVEWISKWMVEGEIQVSYY